MRFRTAALAVCLSLLTITSISSGKAPLTRDEAEQLEGSASASLDETLTQVRIALSSPSLTDIDQRRAVRAIVRQRFDYPSFSRFTLGRSKSRFSQQQLDRYGCEFNGYLTTYISTRLARYHKEPVRIFRATALPSRDVILSARISGGKYDQAVVTFYLRLINPDAGTWRAIDVSFAGNEVRSALRDQFQTVLQQGGPDGLIAMLDEQSPGQSRCANIEITPPAESDGVSSANGS